jgi:FkbM family methyltransferase
MTSSANKAMRGGSSVMRRFVRSGYAFYLGSPLHPHLGGALKRLLRVRNYFVAREPFVHDIGPFRMNIDLAQLIDTSIYTMGTWEAASIASIQRLLPMGGTAVDVGANIGFMTLHMAVGVGEEGRVFAFEPSSWACHRLRANLALNQMPQVVVERLGLGDREACYQDIQVPYGYPLVGERPWMRESFVLRTLDHYFSEHPIERLDLIKCDTDGFEAEVLRGAQRTIREFRPILLLEVNARGLAEQGASVASLLELLRELGYTLHHEETLEPFIDVEGVADRLGRLNHDLDVVALPRDRR